MYCNNKECPAYEHTESYILKNNKQKVKCGACGNVLERKVSFPNIGSSKNKNPGFQPPEFIGIPNQITLPCGHKIGAIKIYELTDTSKKNYKIPNSLN